MIFLLFLTQDIKLISKLVNNGLSSFHSTNKTLPILNIISAILLYCEDRFLH